MDPYAKLIDHCREIAALEGALSLMQWDQQVLMPAGGTEARSGQTTRLASMIHRKLVSDETRALMVEARNSSAGDPERMAMLVALQRDLKTRESFPLELIERKARVTSNAYQAWRKAREENDFTSYEPHLAEVVEIVKESAALLGAGDHPYDSLIDLYEEGSSFAEAKSVFEQLKPFTLNLLAEIRDGGSPIDDSILVADWDQQRLRQFMEHILREVGFDFSRGRLDIAKNAFCTTFATSDVRMTTRASEHIKGVVSSSIHEMGHALYEQNSNPGWDGTPLQGGASLAIHESQSRTWENVVGRSLPFWTHFLPDLHRFFPNLNGVSAGDMFKMMNCVEPSMIRVGADELTYNLHILIRFELEVELLTGALAVSDLPSAWNEKYCEYLGITPLNDGEGCLQDVHWSRGSFGYFPTYTFGNLIGVQVWDSLNRDVPNTGALIERGEFQPILSWLVQNLYGLSRSLKPKDLVRQLTGADMTPDNWMRYADRKYRALYNLG